MFKEKQEFTLDINDRVLKIQVFPMKDKVNLLALASVQVYKKGKTEKENQFIQSFSSLKLLQGKAGMLITEPTNSYKDKNGEWVNNPYYIAPKQLKEAILNRIKEELSKLDKIEM